MDTLFSINKEEWLAECDAVQKYFNEQIPHDTPAQLQQELDNLRSKLKHENMEANLG